MSGFGPRRNAATVAIFFALSLLGCSGDTSPTSSTQRLDESAGKRIQTNGVYSQVTTTVSTQFLDSRTVSAVFGPDGGTYFVEDTNGKGPKDDLRVVFTVPAGVLDQDVTITMTVSGEDLNTLDVAFQPAGMTFSPAVDMRIDLGNDLALDRDISKITPYHIYADGSTADVDLYHIDRSSNTANFFFKVPSFSRYGLRTSN